MIGAGPTWAPKSKRDDKKGNRIAKKSVVVWVLWELCGGMEWGKDPKRIEMSPSTQADTISDLTIHWSGFDFSG